MVLARREGKHYQDRDYRQSNHRRCPISRGMAVCLGYYSMFISYDKQHNLKAAAPIFSVAMQRQLQHEWRKLH